jgi:uncharacterized protein (DUF305 family)
MRPRRHPQLIPVRARFTAAAGPAALAGLLLTGCGTAPDQDGSGAGAGPSAASSPAASSPAASAGTGQEAAAGTLSGTDLAWLQLMAPMNDRTLLLLELIRARTGAGDGSAELHAFATELDTTHRAELRAMRRLLTEAGVPDTNPHAGHDMTGMITDEELREVQESGPDFERSALVRLREHLEQSAMLSRSAREAGTDRDTTALAGELTEIRAAQLNELARIGG